MRIITGEVKGLRVKVPRNRGLRPTSGLVRGAVFSMLSALDVAPGRVLDLYAGTGALGLEALSRGARWVDFVEQDQRSCALIRENLKALGLEQRGHIYSSAVSKAIGFLTQPYDLILADPPYQRVEPDGLLASLNRSGAVAQGSIVVLESSRRSSQPETPEGMNLIKERRHGDTCIWIYRKESGF